MEQHVRQPNEFVPMVERAVVTEEKRAELRADKQAQQSVARLSREDV